MSVGDGGLGIEIQYSQFPLHTPRLHCAQPMRKDSNLGVPSDVNSLSLRNLKTGSLAPFPDSNKPQP